MLLKGYLKLSKSRPQSEAPTAILLRLTPPLLAKLDEAAAALNMTRTDIIRRSLMRDMQFVVSFEMERAAMSVLDVATAHAKWVEKQRVAQDW